MLGLVGLIIAGLALMLLTAVVVGRFIAYGMGDDDYETGRGLWEAADAAEPAPCVIYPIALARARRDRGSAA